MNFQLPPDVLDEVKTLLWPGKLDRLVKHPDYNFMFAQMENFSDLDGQSFYFSYKALYEFNVVYLDYTRLDNDNLLISINITKVPFFNHSDIFCQFIIECSRIFNKWLFTDNINIKTKIINNK